MKDRMCEHWSCLADGAALRESPCFLTSCLSMSALCSSLAGTDASASSSWVDHPPPSSGQQLHLSIGAEGDRFTTHHPPPTTHHPPPPPPNLEMYKHVNNQQNYDL